MWTAIGLGVILLTFVVALVAVFSYRDGADSGLKQKKGKRNDSMI